MMKLLVVDDEQVEREGITAILHSNFTNLTVEQAENGRIAVEMAKTFKPNLVLMDHKMPGMSGLEAIEEIKKIDAAIKFIMVTAYAEFSYAKSAIRLGVKDYLLKPTKASEIVHTVKKAITLIEQEEQAIKESSVKQKTLQKALPIIETDVVTQLLFDHVHDIHFDELVGLLDIPMKEEMFVISILIPQGKERLYASIKQTVHEKTSAWVGAMYGRQVPVIVFRKTDQSFRSQAIELAREILLLTGKEKINWFIGIGNVHDSLDNIRQSYQESLIATKDINLPVKYRFYSDLPRLDTGINEYSSQQLEKQLFDQIRNGQKQDVFSSVLNLIHHYENKGADLLQTQQRVLELLWIAARALHEIGVEPETPIFSYQVNDYEQLRLETRHLLDQMWLAYVGHFQNVEDDTIQKIKQYIMAHSHEPISLDRIAQKVELSPIYISKLFKERLGINYIHFLTTCRIEMAKKLMMDQELSFKEITFKVGYHDPNYFSKVFKKICGESPTVYRKSLTGGKASVQP